MKENVTTQQISQVIKNYLFENYLFGYSENEFDNNTSFLEFGVLDSLGIFELIAFIEKQFEIEIIETDILPENLDSINGASRLVYNKINAAAEVIRFDDMQKLYIK